MRKLFCDKCKNEVDKLRPAQGKVSFGDGYNSLEINLYIQGFTDFCEECWKESIDECIRILKEK